MTSWRQIVTTKVRNQAANLAHLKRVHTVLTENAKRCEQAAPLPVGVKLTNEAWTIERLIDEAAKSTNQDTTTAL